MNSRSINRFAWSFLLGTMSPFVISELAEAAHISRNLDIPGTRGRISDNEGYLSFQHAGSTFNGEERTGWTDIRHPAFFNGAGGPQILTTDNRGIGYDRSDFHVDVRNVIVTDNSMPRITAMPNIERDYDFANQIYAQLGISVLNAGNVSATYDNVIFPIANTQPAAIDPILGVQGNRANPPIINNYYIRDFANNPNPQQNPPLGTFGFTVSPEDTPRYAEDGILVIDPARGARTDTFAHELGHFLIDNHRFAGNNGCNTVHSGEGTDLMACGGPPNNPVRDIPGEDPKGLGNTAPKEPGQAVGNIGGLSQFDGEQLRPTNSAGAFDIPQIAAIFADASDGNTYVQRQDNGFTHGDRADFDWVEDNIPLELAGAGPGGDNLADNHDGVDFLIWEIANIAPSPHQPDHNHGDWLMGNEPEVTLGRFNDDTFRIIDVISQIARYADMDVAEANIAATGEMQGEWSPRQSALDYRGGTHPFVQFSKDGITWKEGKPILVFEDGWTFRSQAEDYVARWLAPFDAKFVQIAAEPLGGLHDGNTQIDAIIAGNSRRRVQYMPDPTKPAAGIDPDLGMLASMTFDGGNRLSFGNVIAQLLFLNGGIESVGDPLEGATFVIDDTFLIGANSEGWEFSDTTLELILNGVTVLTADIVDSFLFAGSSSHPEFDSHFQGLFSNIFIDNSLSSPYLDDLQAFIDGGGLSFFSFSSDILSVTNNLTTPGSSDGLAWGQDGAKVPEPSSIFGIFAVGGLGLMGLKKKRQ